jgi:iron complex outermembrane receptor protein
MMFRQCSSTAAACAFTLALSAVSVHPMLAQAGSGVLKGKVVDARGGLIPNVAVTAKNEATGASFKTTSTADGQFSFTNLPSGLYTVTYAASGFALIEQKAIPVSDASTPLTTTLQVNGATDEIQVDADATHSQAAALAPMDALLGETSARTEITQAMIQNFMSPVADYGEAVEMAPATFTLNGNGVGLGQSKTYFRGFPDGDYNIDFDGIPFYDTNTPTHHSWAFFPSQFLGGIDFDRSPGTASTIGPTPFGGSIHLLSENLSPLDNVRVTFSGGSYNTYLYDAAYDSGSFGPGHKFNLSMDVHHLQSHGYETENNQRRDGGDIKFEYKFNPKTIFTGYSAVIQLTSNTPNYSATRCQMYGVTLSASECAVSGTTSTGATVNLPFTGAGINFLSTGNSDPLLYTDANYNYYHVPTDFEYVGLHKELPKKFLLEFKGYTYNYDNAEKYANATTITELTSASFPATAVSPKGTYLGLPVAPCNTAVTKKGVSALPCGVDKYNSYRTYGETSELSQVSKFGILRTGLWFQWSKTNRHQYPSDPLTSWTDQLLPNFSEFFNTSSYQPFVEYEFHLGSKLSFTPGVKLSYYSIQTKQYADDGKTIGNLGTGSTPATPGTGNPYAFITNGGSYFSVLPSGSVNYRIQPGWSVYGQIAQGSIVPPSSVFDYAQSTTPGAPFLAVASLPKQQLNTTYQFGTVVKLKKVTFDADYYHIYFDNSYSSVSTPASGGEPVNYLQPASITQGMEAESNIYLTHGLSLYLNASYDNAVYTGVYQQACTSSAAGCTSSTPFLSEPVPGGLHVQQTPSDVETEGLTYQRGAWDLGAFNKRVGTFYVDNGQYHNQFTVDPFSVTNLFFNYTVRSNNRFDQTKLRLSFNNLFNNSNLTGITLNGTQTAPSIMANGTTYADSFNASTALSGADNISILPGRSISLTATFGLSPKKR